MNMQTIGTCSLCGGPVQLPLAWWGTVAPVPSCSTCGAVPANPHGPVIQMEPKRSDLSVDQHQYADNGHQIL